MNTKVGDPRRVVSNLFHGVRDLASEMNRIADAMARLDVSTTHGVADAWKPDTDVFARATDLVVRCEIPQVRPEDLEVTASRDHLTITGTRRHVPGRDTVYYATGRFGDTFRQEIALPAGVEHDDIHAVLGDGRLEITVTNAAQPPRTVQVTVDSPEEVPLPRSPGP